MFLFYFLKKNINFFKDSGMIFLQIPLNSNQYLNSNNFFFLFSPKKMEGYADNFDRI
jgi:hypothetical protein